MPTSLFFRLWHVLMLAMSVIACQPEGQVIDNSKLRPGDEIKGMVITTGARQAPPLWAFCSPAEGNECVLTFDCHVPLLSKLAIGYPFEGADGALQTLDWSTLSWELAVDGQAVNLEAFGTYDYVMPDLAPHPSPIREIFRQMKAWDIVLTHLTPGMHTLHAIAGTGTNAYSWTANFAVEPTLAR
jgi:hypothetical protein